MIRDRHHPHELLVPQDRLGIKHRLDRRRFAARRAHQDLRHLIARGVPHHELEEEPVQLRLRQWVRALLLDRVLRRHHKEGRRQSVRFARDRDAPFLHRLEHRRLRLGRRTVDLVGKHDLRKDRPGLEREFPRDPAAGPLDFRHDRRARDVRRHQIGRELHAPKVQTERLRQGADQQRLADPRHTLEQRVPARKQTHQDAVDDRRIPNDHAADLIAHRDVIGLELPAELVEFRVAQSRQVHARCHRLLLRFRLCRVGHDADEPLPVLWRHRLLGRHHRQLARLIQYEQRHSVLAVLLGEVR